jgi:hypothetical protein
MASDHRFRPIPAGRRTGPPPRPAYIDSPDRFSAAIISGCEGYDEEVLIAVRLARRSYAASGFSFTP